MMPCSSTALDSNTLHPAAHSTPFPAPPPPPETDKRAFDLLWLTLRPDQGFACVAYPTGRGVEGKKKFVYLKWASHSWLHSKFHFSREETIFGFVWRGGLAWGGGWGPPDRPPPPPPSVVKPHPGPARPGGIQMHRFWLLCVGIQRWPVSVLVLPDHFPPPPP